MKRKWSNRLGYILRSCKPLQAAIKASRRKYRWDEDFEDVLRSYAHLVQALKEDGFRWDGKHCDLYYPGEHVPPGVHTDTLT